MGLDEIKNRIKRAETNARGAERLGQIAAKLAKGGYYDDLTDEEKTAYCEYLGADREAWEAVTMMIYDTLHIQIERKQRPPTPEEHAANIAAVEAFIKEAEEAYNSPEAAAERERQYNELQEEARQRRAMHNRNRAGDQSTAAQTPGE